MNKFITNYKKRVAILTILCMLFTFIPMNVFAATKSDVPGHWAKDTIQKWIDQGSITGYQDGTFRPEKKISRAEFMTIVNGIFNYTEMGNATFTDVKTGAWYANAVAKASAAGYITGYPDGTMRPNSPISREEAASMIMRISKLKTNSDAARKFTDEGLLTWSKGAVGAVCAANIMDGYPDLSFQAKNNIKRGEAVVALDKAASYSKNNTTYDKAGTYGPATGVLQIEGNVIVLEKGITLQNMVIAGGLIIDKNVGEGNVTLKNVTVKRETKVYGGGENSVIIIDSTLGKVTVLKENGKIRIVISGTTSVVEVCANSGVKLEESNLAGDKSGFQEVILDAKSDDKIILIGTFTNVEINSPGLEIQMPKGTTIDKMTLNEKTEITGVGIVKNAAINVSGVVFETKPAKMDVATGATAPKTGASAATTSGNSSGGGSTGSGTTPAPTQTYAQAKAAADTVITNLVVTNATTADAILNAVKAVVTNPDIKVQWEASQGFFKLDAVVGTAGTITGTIDLLIPDQPTLEVKVAKTIAPLPTTTYGVTLGTITKLEGDTDSTVIIDTTQAAAGTTVTLTVVPKAGMQLKAGTLRVNYNDGQAKVAVLSGSGPYTFIMPAYGVSISAEFEVTPEIVFMPNYTANFTANTNNFSFMVRGKLTDNIDVNKLKYMTSETGGNEYNLVGNYGKVSFTPTLSPGEYYYSESGSDTIVYIKLTENDSNAVKALPGYGNDTKNVNPNHDRLVAETGWYPQAQTGTKAVSISNDVVITNTSGFTVTSKHTFLDTGVNLGSSSLGLNTDTTSKTFIHSLAKKIVFYVGNYSPNVTPTTGAMKIVDVTADTITNGIILDSNGWIDVDETNFGIFANSFDYINSFRGNAANINTLVASDFTNVRATGVNQNYIAVYRDFVLTSTTPFTSVDDIQNMIDEANGVGAALVIIENARGNTEAANSITLENLSAAGAINLIPENLGVYQDYIFEANKVFGTRTYLQNKINFANNDKVCVDADFNALASSDILGGNASLSNVTQDLTLPPGGANGSGFFWSSSNENVISPQGAVTRPALPGNATVTLTVKVLRSWYSLTKEFIITVPSIQSDNNVITAVNFNAYGGLQQGNANVAVGATVGIIQATGGDAPINYSLAVSNDTSDDDNDKFVIDGTYVKVASGITLAAGTYNFYVKATDANDDILTLPCTITVSAATVDNTAPTLSNGTIENLASETGTTAKLNFEATQEAGSVTTYYLVQLAGVAAPTADYVKENPNGTSTTSGNPVYYTIHLTGLTPESIYNAYIVMEDASGNWSNMITVTGIRPVSNAALTELGQPSVLLDGNTSGTGGLSYTITAPDFPDQSYIKEYTLAIAPSSDVNNPSVWITVTKDSMTGNVYLFNGIVAGNSYVAKVQAVVTDNDFTYKNSAYSDYSEEAIAQAASN